MAARGAPPGALGEADLREAIVRADALRAQLTAVEGQRELVHELASDARRAVGTLEALEKAKDGDELLVPIGAGTFAHAKVDRAGRAIAALGNGVHVETTTAEARARMQARVEGLEQAQVTLTRDAQRIADELARLNALLEQAYEGG